MKKVIGKLGKKAMTTLAVLLCAMMTVSLLPSEIVAVQAANTLLIDLDVSTYQRNASSTKPADIQGSIGNITDSGTLNGSTVVKMYPWSGSSYGLDIKKESFNNAEGGQTQFLHKTVQHNVCKESNRYATVSQSALETQANTISFWARPYPVNRNQTEYNMFNYCVKYDGTEKNLFNLDQNQTTMSKFPLVGRYVAVNYGDQTAKCGGKWAHYVITNPEYVDGSKDMKLYINGAYVGKQTVTKPSGTLQDAQFAFGGEISASGIFQLMDLSFGDVKVYDGVLSESDIQSAYNASKNKFTVTDPMPDITGFTFTDKTVNYDLSTHMNYVTPAANATEKVNVHYTCNGSKFIGSEEPGVYPITATIKKNGYNDLVLNATLTINDAQIPEGGPAYPPSSQDVYSNKIVTYSLNSNCTGYYMTPKLAGKYPTFIMIHGQGGIKQVKERVPSSINNWVKAGYFPPMVVVFPVIKPASGSILEITDFQKYVSPSYDRFKTLLTSVENGELTQQIGTDKRILVAGFSMGGEAATQIAADYNTRIELTGGLSPAKYFYEGEGKFEDSYESMKDIHVSSNPGTHVYLSAGAQEGHQYVGEFVDTINRYHEAISYNAPDGVTRFIAKTNWGGHAWPLEQKEIFMYLYYATYGVIPSRELVESACDQNAYTIPEEVSVEEEHTGQYIEPDPLAQNITGYTFSNLTVDYDGENHNIEVMADANATEGVDIAYTLNGAPFTGATEAGKYNVTATLTKEGYNTIILNATLKIKAPVDPNATGYVLYGLDLSKMKKDVGTHPYTGTSGVEGTGDWADDTSLVIRSKEGVTIDKGTFTNANGNTTEYISLENTNADWITNTIGFNFSTLELEDNDNTISFWVDPERYTGKNTEILQYYVEYNGGTASFDLSMNTEGAWNAQNNSTDTTADAYSVSGGWKHVVITNPKCSGGAKTMDVYINGQLKDTVTLNIPDNAAITNATVSLAARNQGDGFKYRVLKSAKYGNIEVRKGVMEAQDIQDLYEEQLPLFTEGTSTLENITGYTFENATVEYDGASHNITVTAGENATEGVDVAYTVNGAAFSGATEVGTYNVTATLTKAGYNKLILTATLTIEPKAAQPVDDGDILFELDLSNFAPGSTESPAGLANKGTSTTAQITAHSSSDVTLTTDYLHNKDDLSVSKKVLRITHLNNPDPEKISANRFEIKDPAFEEQDITLSFWTNLDPVSKQTSANSYYAIAQYNAKRSDGTFRNAADSTNSRGRVWQTSLETDPNSGYLWSNNWANDTFVVGTAKQWHHVVMTIPKFQGGAKLVKVYVDGVEKLSESLSLGGKTLQDSWISLGCDENGNYIPGDMSLSDVKVYAGVMSADGISALYDSEKDFYDNMAYNKITVSKNGSAINKLSNLEAGDSVTISYNENMETGVTVFAACYDEDDNLISASLANADGTGEFTLSLPSGFNSVKIYTWNAQNLSPLQKVSTLYK